jgi:hypothetical protein
MTNKTPGLDKAHAYAVKGISVLVQTDSDKRHSAWPTIDSALISSPNTVAVRSYIGARVIIAQQNIVLVRHALRHATTRYMCDKTLGNNSPLKPH